MRRLAVALALLLGIPAVAAGGRAPARLVATLQTAFGGATHVTCRNGAEVVTVDLGDSVQGRCRVVSRLISTDPSSNPNSQHETALQPASAANGNVVVAVFQAGRYVVGGSSNIETAVSTDAGRTWARSVLPGITVESKPAGTATSASDNTVAYDAVHSTWLAGTLTLSRTGTAVVVSRSNDGEQWTFPVSVATGPSLDKDWLVCDNGAASPHRGRCYVTYTDWVKNWTVVQWSDDGGVTWSPPLKAWTTLLGTQPVVTANGTLVVVAAQFDGAQGLTGSVSALVSGDGGRTFSSSIVSTLQAHAPGALRALSLPTVAIDSQGKLYAVWHDCRFRPDCSVNDLVLSTSANGAIWTPPVRIPVTALESTQEEFLPALAVDPKSDDIALLYAYYLPDSCAAGACRLGVGLVASGGAGQTWSGQQQLQALSMSTNWLARGEKARMLGNYFGLAFAGSRLVPVFALAAKPHRGLREGIFASSIPVSAVLKIPR